MLPPMLVSEFGPSSWTAENWMGAGITVGAFSLALWLAVRLARGGDGRKGSGR